MVHFIKNFIPRLYVLPALLFFILCSCQQGLVGDPRLYNTRKTTEDTTSPPADVEIPEEEVPEDEDPFINGEWNDINYGGFSGEVFKTWVLNKVNFSDQNIPSYRFATSGKSWTRGGTSYEYTYDAGGEGNKAQGYSIKPMTVYQYRSKNPLVSATSSYNKDGGRMERFYFHRIKGESGGGIAKLDQYLIAVDTRSKFVFAYAKVTETKNLLGNVMPTAFEAMENYGELRPFYQYDPIGYVGADGSVTLYKQYETDMINSDAVNFEPSIHNPTDMTMASHKPDGEGRSPYYGTPSADDAKESFKGNMQDIIGNTYKRREGMYLYTYTIKDEETIVRTGEKWQDTEEVPVKTFLLSEVFSGITAYFTAEENGETVTYTVNLKDKDTQITFKEENLDENVPENEQVLREVTAYRNFDDPGPGFVLRVAGKVFQYTEDDEAGKLMTFSEDGMTLTDERTGKTFTLSSEGSETQAKYKNGSYYYPLELSEGDSLIKWGTEFFVESWVSYGTCNYHPAQLIQNDKGSFHENVSGRIYKMRDGLLLYSLEFTNGGKTATVKTEEWRTNKTATVETLTLKEDGSETSASAVYGGKTFTITDLSTMSQISVSDGKTYDLHFEDPGPEFLLRLQNDVTFANDSDDSYEFLDGGRTLVMNGDTYTFVRQDSPNNRAVYTKKILGTPWYYGVELSEGDDGTKDNKVKITSGWGENTIGWGTLGWEAERGFEVTDSFAANVAGKTYLMRDGLDLYTYAFSEDGRSVDTSITVWRETTAREEGTIKWQSQTDGTNAVFAVENSDGSVAEEQAFVISDAGRYLDAGGRQLERSDTFSDPGPEFLLRVAGAVYDNGKTGTDQVRYEFSNDGRTFTLTAKYLFSVKTWTYTYSKEANDNTEAMYNHDGSFGDLNFGVKLYDNDLTIKTADASPWTNMKYEAYRVE